ncbi:MAG: hypothetical protein EP343_10150 [Deltaproteobacteria bacterium]|nr:MAG: hypothetical protein EP343_10150 [Deltaproteobacteria bacterium]
MLRRLGWISFSIVLFALASTGCQCGDAGVGNCKENTDCTGRLCDGTRCACLENKCTPVQCLQKFHCETGFECSKDYKCVGDTPTCTKDEDCPEGTKCNTESGRCEKDPDTCSENNDCAEASKICCDLGDGTGKRCNFKKCLKNEDCAQGGSNTCVEPLSCNAGEKEACVKGVCQCAKSCGGDCGDGKCCDAENETCIANPDPCPNVTCQPGFDPPDRSKYKPNPATCKFDTAPVCDCVKKPPLEEGPNGLYPGMALHNGTPVVSGYNKKYGDLVVGTRQSDGSIKWEYVDGIPSGAQPTGAPDGPRGGISEEGDDVGYYTSIASDNTNIHVAYHDATNGSLKYARKTGDKWVTMVVDKNGSGIGRFTAIALDNGVPVVAYYVLNNGKGQAELRIAKGSSATPASESDWSLSTVDTTDLPGCKGTCESAKKEACVDQNKTPTCAADTGDCPNKCGSDEVCVNKACLKKVAADGNDDIDPKGAGLFPSIAIAGGKVYVAYYDQSKGDLKLARSDSGGQYVTGAVYTKGDVGDFPSVVIGKNGNIHISFGNADTADIHYIVLDPQLKIVLDEIADDGQRAGEDRRLADTALVLDDGGVPLIVYQDASVQSLMIATRQGDKKWDVKKIVGEDPTLGAFGFFNTHLFFGGKSYISNYNYLIRGAKDDSKVDIRIYP